jgi:hypothetical protein
MHYLSISQLYFGTEFYIFRTDLLSIIRSLNAVFTAMGICHICYVDRLLAKLWWNSSSSSITTSLAVNIRSTTNTHCCEYSIQTPDDGQ